MAVAVIGRETRGERACESNGARRAADTAPSPACEVFTLSREEAIARYREAQSDSPLVTCDGRLLEAPIGYYCLITPFPDAPEDRLSRILLHSGNHRNFDYPKRGLSERQIRRLRNELNRYDIVGLDPERDVKYDPVLQAFSEIRIVGMQERPGYYWKRFPRDGGGEQYVACGSINALIGDDTDHLVQLIEEQQSLYYVGAVEDDADATVRDVSRISMGERIQRKSHTKRFVV